MRFEFATAGRILFGPGASANAASLAADLGRRAFVVTGQSPERAAPLVQSLRAADIQIVEFRVSGEPTTHIARAAAREARDSRCDFVVSFGGGSAIDLGKACAALMANLGDVLEYLEVVGKGQPPPRRAAPHIALPTTAGTGAEVTRNAVLGSPEHRIKASMRSPGMLPTVAIVDPLLTHSVPPAETASTGMDALTQLIEAFVSCQANPLTDSLCREGIARASRALRRAFRDGADAEAREDMALASLFGGLALANAKLGAVHGFAGVIGGMFPAPHGAVCAALLAPAFAANAQELRRRAGDSAALSRLDEVGQLLTGRPTARADDAARWLAETSAALELPRLSAFGLNKSDFADVVQQAQRASSMKGNPIELTPEELAEILRQAC